MEQSAPTFTPFQASNNEFDTKTRHCETTRNSILSMMTNVNVAVLRNLLDRGLTRAP